MELNYLESLAKIFIIPGRQNQFIQENIFDNAPVCRIAIIMNTNSALIGSYIENPFCYQQFDLRQIRKLRGGQPTVDFHAADICRLYVTTMKATNFQDDIPAIPIDNFNKHYVLVFGLTSMQNATENFHHSELVEEPLRLELIFIISSRTRYWTHFIGNKCLRMHLVSLVLLKKSSTKDNVSPANKNRIPLLKYSVPWFFSL